MLDEFYINELKDIEGFTPKAFWDYKQWTNGYGTKARSKTEVIDKPEGDRRLRHEVAKMEAKVDKFAPNLPQGTRAALISLSYNSGTAWMSAGLGKAVKASDQKEIKKRFKMYNKAGGKTLAGLVKRRAREAKWIGQDKPTAVA